MKKLMLAFVVILMIPFPVRGDVNSGNEMYQNCTGSKAVGQGLRLGFITGSTQTLVVMEALYGVTPPFCAPGEATMGQMRDIFNNYLKDHPEDRHLYAGILFFEAMQEKFPC